ncbi:hypothetical protein [uncultured Shewanella sp.]|uniref:hypothetical protein n=1 Tax=uncultured Shewanella sp. TaxID=173975 RepID=UPI00260713BB|nr:hypothetical protein [uncultured Shewanella sp.]
MQTSAIAKLGKNMAGKIGEAAENKNINQVVRYMSHAALGCGLGLATANVHGSDKKNKISCLSGAGGAVVGEVIADTFKSQKAYNKAENDLESALAELGMDEDAFKALTTEQQAVQIATHTSLETAMERLEKLKTQGVDLAKLGSALVAFVANADVNIAADAGANAAENNAYKFFFQAAYQLYRAYLFVKTIDDLVDKFKDFVKATPEERNQILINAAIGLGIDFIGGKTVKETAGALLKYLKQSNANPKILYEIEYLYDCIDNNKLNAYKPGKGQAWHNSHKGSGQGSGLGVGEGLADPSSIRFTQDSIKATFKDGRSLKDLIDDLKSGKVTANDLPAIRIFERDGKIFSLDNRRLKAFQEAGVPIRTKPATPDEIANEAFKFTSKNEGASIRVRGGGL